MKTPLLFIVILLLVLPRAVHAQLSYFLQIHFASNSAQLTTEHLKRIDSVLLVLNNKTGRYRVEVTGHADSSGTASQNYHIALKRAESCKALLVQKGCSKKNIHVVSKGSTLPIHANSTEFGKAINRRVDFLFTELPLEQPIRKVDRLSEVLRQQQFKVSAEKGGRLKYNSGTELIIPAKSFVDANGKEIKGKVDVAYVEMRDPIDIALSDIEMTHEHSGEMQVFNSGGMFRVLASQNGRPVYLNGDSALGINFALAQRIPNLNFYTYDSVTRKWTEQRKLTGGNGQSLRPRAADYYNSDFGRYTSGCNMPDFESFLYKINTGLTAAAGNISLYDKIMQIDTVGALRALARSDSAREELRKAEFQLATAKKRIVEEKHVYHVQVLEKKDSLVRFLIHCRGRSFNEFENFDKVEWQQVVREQEASAKDLGQGAWTTCEIEHVGNAYTIQFKNLSNSITLSNVQLLPTKEIARSERMTYLQVLNTQYQVRYENYLQLLENLNKDVEDLSSQLLTIKYAANKLKDASNRFNWYYGRIFGDSLYCFWTEHQKVMSPVERAMRFENWLQYYDAHRQQYVSMYLREKRSAKYAYSVKRDRQYRKYLEMLALETEKINDRNEMVESLQIQQLGLCNIDALMRYNFVNRTIIAFKDAKGKDIDVQNVKLIDAGINSAVSFSGKKALNQVEVSYNPNGETSLLVFDADNNLYVCSRTSFEREAASDADKHMDLMAVKVEDKKNKSLIKTLMQ